MSPVARPGNVGVVLEHRPGALARLGRVLGDAGVGLEGGGVFVHRGEAVANFLVDDADRAARVLEEHGMGPVRVDDVVTLRLDQDATGELGAFAATVAAAGIDLLVQYSDHDHRLVLVVAPEDHDACEQVARAWSARRGAGPRDERRQEAGRTTEKNAYGSTVNRGSEA